MAEHPIIAPKKLIEVALPLDEINKAAAREKSIRHGHPSTLHLWWARRPLAAARAVLFAQLVNDPSWRHSEEELRKPQVRSSVTKKRNELFRLITELVQWESTCDERVLSRARQEIRASWEETCHVNRHHPRAHEIFDPERIPALHDPFAGGGTIPLEAQRLGLDCHATDLNPVAVLMNKAMIEIPPRFAGRPPVGPLPKGQKQTSARAVLDWSGANGLAEDVRRYGAVMREEAEKQIGHLYPKIRITKELCRRRPDLKPYEGEELTTIAWIWVRTVKSPNPAFGDIDVPLASTFILATKEGKEAWIDPVIDGRQYRFVVRVGTPDDPDATERGTKSGGSHSSFLCLMSKSPMSFDYLRNEARENRMGVRLAAIVAEGKRGRVYLSPTDEAEQLALSASPKWIPRVKICHWPGRTNVVEYGLTDFGQLYTPRQLVALTTFADIAQGIRERVRADAAASGVSDDGIRLDEGGCGATAYADAVATYLALAVARYSNACTTICSWNPGQKKEDIRFTFSRQALPMTWDFAEGNPFSDSSGNFADNFETWLFKCIRLFPAIRKGVAEQADAAQQTTSENKAVSTDPPYYDNIEYADLSDFFYIWLRRTLKSVYPGLFATMAVPKDEELVANPYRRGGKEQADRFFLDGMTKALRSLAEQAHPGCPITIYYAFKQSETEGEGTSSTGWETFLDGVLRAGLAVVGTWPMRTEREGRSIGVGANALASSIILVCRRREGSAGTVARKDFLREIERTLPVAIAEMTADPVAAIAPVDLAQACIGPGMAIFSRHHAVLEADGSPMSVRGALVHINKAIDNYFAEAEGDLDPDTRFCIGWFQQYGFDAGPFGEADVLARAKGTSVDGVKEAGVVDSAKGKVRLLRIKEYPADWNPATDSRTPAWEACHQMCRALGLSEHDAGELLARMPDRQDAIRQLAYRLYTLCERQGRAEEARAYNELITSWPAIVEESQKVGHIWTQTNLLGSEPTPSAPKKKGRRS